MMPCTWEGNSELWERFCTGHIIQALTQPQGLSNRDEHHPSDHLGVREHLVFLAMYIENCLKIDMIQCLADVHLRLM